MMGPEQVIHRTTFTHELDEEVGHYEMDSGLAQFLSAVAPFTGDEFFLQAVRALPAILGMTGANIVEFQPGALRGRIIAASRGGGKLVGDEYALSGSATQAIIDTDCIAIPEGAALRFPQDEMFQAEKPEAVLGVVLKSLAGIAIGALTCHDSTPLVEAAQLLQMLSLMAARVSAEVERRHRELALQHSMARLHTLTEHSGEVLYLYRLLPHPRLEYLNPAVEELTGYPPEAFLADTGLLKKVLHDEGELDKPVEAAPVLTQLTRFDGAERWVEHRLTPLLDGDGNLAAVSGSLHDVTDRVSTVQALELSKSYSQALLASMPDTLLRIDGSGGVLDYVPGEGIRGLKIDKADLIGRNIRDLLPAAIWVPMLRLAQSAVQIHETQVGHFDIQDEERNTVGYEVRCVPFRNLESLVILRDLTEQKWHDGDLERQRPRDEINFKGGRANRIPYDLTHREVAVLNLIAAGQADKQIAESLGISTYTVNKHVGNILGKMGAASRTEAGVRAIREKLAG